MTDISSPNEKVLSPFKNLWNVLKLLYYFFDYEYVIVYYYHLAQIT